MVLEHLHDPILALQKLRSCARPGSCWCSPYPTRPLLSSPFNGWHALDLPRHLCHYTLRTLATVLETDYWKMGKVFYQRVTNLFGQNGRMTVWAKRKDD